MTDSAWNKFGRIGGTTVSAIVGMNPWESPHGAYLKLRKEVGPTPDNPAMALGRRFEPIVADVFQGGHQEFRVAHNRRGTDAPELFEHAEYPYLIGHPDRLLYDARSGALVEGLEIKTSNWSNVRLWGEEGTDAVPTNYLIQCQWYAGLAQLPVWRVAVAFLDDLGSLRQYKEYKINADAELFATLVERAVDFWERFVVPGVAPEIDTVDETTARWVAQKFARNVEPMAEASPEEERVMAAYIAKKEALEAAQKELEQVEVELKLAIGDRDGLASQTFGKVTWKRSKDSQRVDYKGVCEELDVLPEVLARHTKTVEGSRRFVTTGLKTHA